MSDQSQPLPNQQEERLKLWLISQQMNTNENAVRAAIVAAATHGEARHIVPVDTQAHDVEWADINRMFKSTSFADEIYEKYKEWRAIEYAVRAADCWTSPEWVTTRLLGDAFSRMKRGVIMFATNEKWSFVQKPFIGE